MKKGKSIIGMSGIVLSIIILIQFLTMEYRLTTAQISDANNTIFLFVALFLMAGGVTELVMEDFNISIISSFLYLIGFLICINNYDRNTGLRIWCWVCLILSIASLILFILKAKKKQKIIITVVTIVLAFLFIPTIITILTNSDLEKIKEEKDLANLNEAYATAVLMMAENKNSFNNSPMWYNPQTGKFMYKKVISGKGTDKKRRIYRLQFRRVHEI